MKKINRTFFHSTFFRLCMVFILAGFLPILFVIFLFYMRFNAEMESAMQSSFYQLDYYMCESIGNIFQSADKSMGYLYDYSTNQYEYLYEVLKAEDLTQIDKAYEIYPMLRDIVEQNTYISSARFVDLNNDTYSYYADQGKILIEGKELFNTPEYTGEDPYRDLKIMPTVIESEYCMNSNDYVFTMVRNYMDTSSVERIKEVRLGTLYVDINVKEIQKITSLTASEEERNIFVINKESKTLVYSENVEDYGKSLSGVDEYLEQIKGIGGDFRYDGDWVFYHQIPDSSCYVCIVLNDVVTIHNLFQGKTTMLIAIITGFMLLLLFYIIVSRKFSNPISEILASMQQVKQGNLNVHIQAQSRDEMAYVIEGFNEMVGDLKHYIEQVYVAQLKQRESELNALRMQIKPHYLYNTLDVIRMTALENNDKKTASLLLALSSQLRYLMGKQSDVVYLEEEIENIRTYFVITKVRYADLYSLSINVDDNVKKLKMLKLLLQPIVENAIKHGLRERSGPGMVSISAHRKDNYLEIIVMDDGVGMSAERVEKINEILKMGSDYEWLQKEEKVSVGMKNVYDRIKLNCGEAYGYTITSYEQMGTIITFHLPIWEDTEEE